MQLTIEIPDELAGRLERESANLSEILERGLRQRWSDTAGLGREVVAFLARGPQPTEILRFRPSQQFLERSRDLLDRSKQGPLSLAEAQELDEMAHLDLLVTLIKAEARRHLPVAA